MSLFYRDFGLLSIEHDAVKVVIKNMKVQICYAFKRHLIYFLIDLSELNLLNMI